MTARRLVIVALVVVAMIALAGLADLGTGVLLGQPLRALDAAVAVRSVGLRTPVGDVFFSTITHLGDQLVVTLLVAVSAVGLLVLHKRADALFVVGVVASGALANTFLKQLFDRLRPPAELAAIPIPSSPSFPSGHTVSAFLLFGALAVVTLLELSPRWRGVLLSGVLALTGVVVGYSRLYLGVHWLTDVIGGWLLGNGLARSVTVALIIVRGRPEQPVT